MVGIHPVRHERCLVCLALCQEFELQGNVPCVPVGLSSHIPVVALASGRDNILAYLAINDACLVEHHRQCSDKPRKCLIRLVAGRRVCKHGERAVLNYIACSLMTPRTHRDRLLVYGSPVFPRAVPHCTRCEVHLSRHHSDIWERHVIQRHVMLTHVCPSGLLHSEHSLVVEDVRIRPVQSHGLVYAVQVKKQMMAGRGIGNSLHHLHGRLVITVHEVNLQSLHSHPGVMTANLLKVLVEDVKDRP